MYEDTQAVGTSFATSPLHVASAGRLDLTLTDADFPSRFQSLAMALTHGTTLDGFIFGEGTLTFDAAAEDYAVNVLATPDPALRAGAYGITVSATPEEPPPDDGGGGGNGGGDEGGGGGGAWSPLWLGLLAWRAVLRPSRSSPGCH